MVLKVANIISIWWIFGLLVLWIVLTSIGSFYLKWNYFLKAKHCNYSVNKNIIALTFDDGPHPIFTPKVLKLLKQYNAKATFFCIGKNAEKHPEIIRKLISEGHSIGNHSYSHAKNYGFLSTRKIITDLSKAQDVLKEITNREIILFRPPFGVTNPNIGKAVIQLNLQTFGWSIRAFDTVAKNPNKVFLKINSRLKKGDVVLLHDTSHLSIIVLEQLLRTFKQNRIKSVTLNQLFNI